MTEGTSEPTAKEAELRATSDQLLLALDAVSVLERQKRGVEPGHDQFLQLATDVRLAAEVLLTLARGEEAIAREVRATPESQPMPTIDETEAPPSLALTLEQWREVERRIADAKPGSDEAGRLLVEFEQLRRTYATTLARIMGRGGMGDDSAG